jgi:hypothetical protein
LFSLLLLLLLVASPSSPPPPLSARGGLQRKRRTQHRCGRCEARAQCVAALCALLLNCIGGGLTQRRVVDWLIVH